MNKTNYATYCFVHVEHSTQNKVTDLEKTLIRFLWHVTEIQNLIQYTKCTPLTKANHFEKKSLSENNCNRDQQTYMYGNLHYVHKNKQNIHVPWCTCTRLVTVDSYVKVSFVEDTKACYSKSRKNVMHVMYLILLIWKTHFSA